jgi:hypothetical protein
MATAVTADISKDVLASSTADSDRFVYSNYFVPLLLTFGDGETPIVPFFIKQRLLENLRYGALDDDRLSAILQQLQMPELLAMNHMERARAAFNRAGDVVREAADGADPNRNRASGEATGELRPGRRCGRRQTPTTTRASGAENPPSG